MDIIPIALPNPGILHTWIPPEPFEEIRRIAREKINDEYKEGYQNRLVGQIDHEYAIPEISPLIEQPLLEMAHKYNEYFPDEGYDIDTNTSEFEVTGSGAWINYQYKHEYNPIHDHIGMFSFVSWLDIPYTRESELKVAPGQQSSLNCSGTFSFVYTNIFGEIQNFVPEPNPELLQGRMVLFPARLKHIVYPFYSSDQPRISIAGNIVPVPKK